MMATEAVQPVVQEMVGGATTNVNWLFTVTVVQVTVAAVVGHVGRKPTVPPSANAVLLVIKEAPAAAAVPPASSLSTSRRSRIVATS
jgi:hypothetical protein